MNELRVVSKPAGNEFVTVSSSVERTELHRVPFVFLCPSNKNVDLVDVRSSALLNLLASFRGGAFRVEADAGRHVSSLWGANAHLSATPPLFAETFRRKLLPVLCVSRADGHNDKCAEVSARQTQKEHGANSAN